MTQCCPGQQAAVTQLCPGQQSAHDSELSRTRQSAMISAVLNRVESRQNEDAIWVKLFQQFKLQNLVALSL